MPSTDPTTLEKLIEGRSQYLDTINQAGSPDADVGARDQAAIAAKRLARIDQVLALMHQGPDAPMTDKRADQLIDEMPHSKLMASDRYRQVYESVPPELMRDEAARQAYAKDTIAKEVTDLPYQRDSILAQITGAPDGKAMRDRYGINALPAQQAAFYQEHGEDVPLPTDLQSGAPPQVVDTSSPAGSTTPIMDNPVIATAAGALGQIPGAKEFGQRMIQGLGTAAASTEELAARAISYLTPMASQDPDVTGALDEFHSAFVTGMAPHEAKNFSDKLADTPGKVLEIVGPAMLAGPIGEAMELPSLAARSTEALAPSMTEEAWTAIGDNILRNLPGAIAASVPIEKDRYDAQIANGVTPADAALDVAESAPMTIAQNLLPIAGEGGVIAKTAQGAGSQAALASAQQYAATGTVDAGDTAIAGLTGAALAGAHVEGPRQTAADVVATRAGFGSAVELKEVQAAHRNQNAKVEAALPDVADPEVKARTEWALAQFHAGEKPALWAIAELRHIGETGLTRNEEAYAADAATASPEAAEMGVTPEAAAQERASEVQAGRDVFGDETTYAAEQGMAEQRMDDSLPEVEGMEPTPEARFNLRRRPTTPEKATAEEIPREPTELSPEDLTPEEREAFARQTETVPAHEVNASGESSASMEAISRVEQERSSGQHRVLIERDGTARPLIGVDAVDTHARPGQVIVQRGVGRNEWTILSHGGDITTDVAHGKINAARPALDDIVREAEGGRARDAGEAVAAPVGTAGERSAAPEAQRPGPRAAENAEALPAGRVATGDVDLAAKTADTTPSPQRVAAGNYRKGHVKVLGLDVTIETPRGSARSGISPEGRPWSRVMNHHYGYIKGTVGADGQHLDVLLGDQPHNPTRQVFVVDQQKPGGGFDEHKVLMGFRNQRAAEQAYKSEYPKDWQGMGRVRAMSVPEFKQWAKGPARDEARVGPVADTVPRVTLRHPQPDAISVHASTPTEGTTATATRAELPRLDLRNAGLPSQRRVEMAEVPRGAPVPEGHGSALLRNIYDRAADPRGLEARAREELTKRKLPTDDEHVENEFERQVVANGFDGVRGDDGRVTVLGHDVPVARAEAETPKFNLGAKKPAEEVKPAAPEKPKYSGPGMSKDAVHSLIRLLKWDGLRGRAEVHQTESDLPSHLQDQIPPDYKGRVKGWYDATTGKVHIIADALETPRDMYRTLAEEHLGHGGLRKIFNDRDLNSFLDKAWSAIPRARREEIGRDYEREDMSEDTRRRTIAEEYLAKLEPHGLGKTLFSRFHDWFNSTARRMGMDVEYTESELRALMYSAHDHQRAGLSPMHNSRSPVDMVTPRFSLTGNRRVSDETFYSALRRSIAEGKGMPKVGDAKVWKQWLDGAQRRGEFKGAERAWMGIDQWLDQREATEFPLMPSETARITRAELDFFVGQHQVRVEENFKGVTPEMKREAQVKQERYDEALVNALKPKQDTGVWEEEDNRPAPRDAHLDEYHDAERDLREHKRRMVAAQNDTSYSQYTLPGGRMYREVLLQLPVAPPARAVQDVHSKRWHVIRHDGTDAGSYYSEYDARQAASYDLANSGDFRSSHFASQPNIVAHTRLTDRTDQGGNDVLMIEEIQSDWHQKGRQYGYKNDQHEYTTEDAKKWFDIRDTDWSEMDDETRQDYFKEMLDRRLSGRVAEAPFKKEWPMLAFKAALRHAVLNDYHKIAWTTGEQQADRYRLSRHIQSIDVEPVKPDVTGEKFSTDRVAGLNYIDAEGDLETLELHLSKDGTIRHGTFEGRHVAEVVGRELADKIMQAPDDAPLTVLDPRDLKVGGEGMKAFYDRMLPNEIGKYVKQWGAEVGTTKLPIGDWGGELTNVHSIDITPEMREAVKQGVPMFSLGRVKEDANTEASMARTMTKPHEDTTLGDRARSWLSKLKLSEFSDGMQNFVQSWIDSGHRVKTLERELFGGFLGDAAESPYKMYNLARNTHAVMAATMKFGAPVYKDGAFQIEQGRKGLFEIFAPLYQHKSGKSLMPSWEFYAAGLRASRLIKEPAFSGGVRENNFTQEDIDLALALEKKYPIFKKVAEEFDAFNKQLLDLAVDRGALSAEEADSWKQHFYVPFMRAHEDLENRNMPKTLRGTARAQSNQRIWSRRLTGRDARVSELFENILANTSYILDRTYRQEFMNRLVDMGEGTALIRVPMASKPVGITTGELARALEKAGFFTGSPVHGQKASPNIQPSPHWSTVEVDRLTPEEKRYWTTVFQRVAPRDPTIVPIMRNGRLEYYRVTDPLLLRTIGAMGHDSFGRVIKFLSAAKRGVTWGITKDPGFMAATWFRDALINWVGSHTPITPFVDNIKGALDTVREDPFVAQLMMAGVGVAPHYQTGGKNVRADLQRKYGPGSVLNTGRKMYEWYNRLGISAEASSRLAIARSVIARGGTLAEAAYQAQDILNYSMRGDYVAARALAQTAPFWNAGLQGLYRFLRGAGISNMRAGDSSQFVSYMTRGSVLVAATLANMWRNQNDPRYNRLTQDEKDRYWHFFLGDEHYKLPKPFEAGVMFGTLPERIWQRLAGNDTTKDTLSAMGEMITEEMRLNLLPQIARQGIEQFANKDTSNWNPIVPGALQDQLPQDQYSPYTPWSARKIAEMMPEKLPWLNSPKRVENLVRGLGGTLGTYTLWGADWLAQQTGAIPPAPTPRTQDYRVVNRFYAGNSEVGDRSKYEDKLYELRDTADQTFNSFTQATLRGDTNRITELASKPALAYRSTLDEMGRSITALRAAEKQTLQNPFLGPDEKRQQLDALSESRVRLLDQYGPMLDDLERQF